MAQKAQKAPKAPKAPKAQTAKAQTAKAQTAKAPKAKALEAKALPKLEDWETLTQEQQEALKESYLKSKYGVGGEHFSIFPNLTDGEGVNQWVKETYLQSLPPSRALNPNTFKEWSGNGLVRVIPFQKGGHYHYMVGILPKKSISLDIWELEKETVKPYLNYTTYNKLGQLTLMEGNYIITNLYSNKNKAFGQAKALGKLFHLGPSHKELELQKEIRSDNYFIMDINNKGQVILKEFNSTTKQPTGKEYSSLGEFLGGRTLPKGLPNILEYIS